MNEPSAPKPDGRRQRGNKTRERVLLHAAGIAAVDGLEGLSFGRVGLAAGVPKSTLQTLFADRESLQAQVLEYSAANFTEGIRRRLPEGLSGFGRLKALCEAWFELVGDSKTPGGCMVTAATAEFRARRGTLPTLVEEHRGRWRAALSGAAESARAEGSLAKGIDTEQLVFEILAMQGAANLSAGRAGSSVLARARRGVTDLLDRAKTTTRTRVPRRQRGHV